MMAGYDGNFKSVSENRITGCRISFKELCGKKVTLRMVAGKISSSIQETHFFKPVMPEYLKT